MYERNWFRTFGHVGPSPFRAPSLLLLVALLARPAAVMAAMVPGDPSPASKVFSLEPAPDEHFGMSTALSDDTLAVGVPFHDEAGDEAAGAVYVYVRAGAGWASQGQLMAPDPGAIDQFGYAVAIDGDTLVAGAPTDDTAAGDNAGSACVFSRSGGTWHFDVKLEAPDSAAQSAFGRSVAISGETIVVGADTDSAAAPTSGSAHVFVRSGGVWTHQAKLVPTEAGTGDEFGHKVDVEGNTAVLTSRFHDLGAGSTDEGAAAVFVRTGASWTQQALLQAADTVANDRFGSAAALGDGLLVVGSWLVDVGGVTNTGAAYVFKRSAGVWSQQAKLVPSDLAFQDHFGNSVAISDGAIVVGSPLDDNAGGSDAGSAYVFAWSAGAWVEQFKLLPGDGRPNDHFGSDVAIDGESIVAGSADADLAAGVDAGAAYVSHVDGLDPWTDLGSGLAGASGVPAFTGTGALIAGLPVTLGLANAAPSALAVLFLSFASTPVPFKGGMLVPIPIAVIQPLLTTPGGTLNLAVAAWPAGVPAGVSLYFQHAIQDAGAPFGVALSNALRAEIP